MPTAIKKIFLIIELKRHLSQVTSLSRIEKKIYIGGYL